MAKGDLIRTPEGTFSTTVEDLLNEEGSRYDHIMAAWQARRKPSTLAAYRRDLEAFQQFLQAYVKKDITEPEVIELLLQDQGKTNRLVFAYVTHLGERGMGAATIKRYVAGGIAGALAAARMLGFINWKLTVPLPKRRPVRNNRGPTGSSVKEVMVSLKKRKARDKGVRGLIAVRDDAIFHLLVAHGLRREEIATLDVNHIDRRRGKLWIAGKADAPGYRSDVPLTITTLRVLDEWLDIRVRLHHTGRCQPLGLQDGPLFVALDWRSFGQRLRPNGIYYIVKHLPLSKELREIEKNLRPHGFRHYAITEVVKKFGIEGGLAFARHAAVNMTMRYLDDIPEKADNAAQALEEIVSEMLQDQEHDQEPDTGSSSS